MSQNKWNDIQFERAFSAKEPEKPPHPQDPTLRCTLIGTKPRFINNDKSFAIWNAVWETDHLKEQLKTKLKNDEAEGNTSDAKETVKELNSLPERKISIKGALGKVTSGEMLICNGRWEKHKQYGWSFNVLEYQSALPQDEVGVAAWLSTRINGIGPTFAKAIVKHFGAQDVYRILDENPNKLRDVRTAKGTKLPEKQVNSAIEAWDDVKAIRQIETFLFSHGITDRRADQLYRFYGDEVIDILSNHPFRITEIKGIGFKVADKIAQSVGVEVDDPERIEACIIYVLKEAESEGHVFLSLKQFVAAMTYALTLEEKSETASPEKIMEGATRLISNSKVVVEDDEYVEQRIYLKEWWEIERNVARSVRQFIGADPKPLFPEQVRPTAPEGASSKEVEALELPTDEQWSVIEQARNNRLSILTGGPGVGKSFAQKYLMDIAENEGLTVHLCAPTGKAARRMRELTGHPAKTIHRLLEFSFIDNGFQRNEENPLKGDLVIVDEASMLQLDLADDLFKSIPDNMHVLLVGDPDQLPPVGAGKLFDDLIKSDLVPRIQLNKIFRQAARSMIIQNSRRINVGKFPYLKKEEAEKEVNMDMLNDFFWIARKDAERTLETTIDMVVNRIPRAFKFDPKEDIMVLAPMKKGKVGLDILNQRLEKELNPGKETIIPKRGIAVGSRIVQTKNMYSRDETDGVDKSVMNGEVGLVIDYDKDNEEAKLSFDQGEREFWLPISDMDSFFLAWAMTIHRSQGSSWPCVVSPVSYAYYKMLSRGLEYVAITRAEKMCVMIGETRALATAIKNVDMKKRNSSLIPRIRKASLSGELF